MRKIFQAMQTEGEPNIYAVCLRDNSSQEHGGSSLVCEPGKYLPG